jgi:hypothetical protein
LARTKATTSFVDHRPAKGGNDTLTGGDNNGSASGVVFLVR